MNSTMQLISFIVSFFYGVIFYYLSLFNFKIIEGLKKYLQNIITFIFVIDIIIIYIIIIYNLNKGYFHIYFIFTVFIGFFVGIFINKKIFSKINVNRFFKHCKTE